MKHPCDRYIGMGYEAVGRCIGLVSLVYAEVYGRDVPPMPDEERGRALWAFQLRHLFRPVASPKDGDLVRGKRGALDHVGVWLAPGLVLSAIEGQGVTAMRPRQLAAGGWGKLSFYRWRAPA